jgi:hypothetical protein
MGDQATVKSFFHPPGQSGLRGARPDNPEETREKPFFCNKKRAARV